MFRPNDQGFHIDFRLKVAKPSSVERTIFSTENIWAGSIIPSLLSFGYSPVVAMTRRWLNDNDAWSLILHFDDNQLNAPDDLSKATACTSQLLSEYTFQAQKFKHPDEDSFGLYLTKPKFIFPMQVQQLPANLKLVVMRHSIFKLGAIHG